MKKIRSLCSDKFLLVDFLEKKQETDTQCENGSVEERKICRLCKLSSLVISFGTRYVSSYDVQCMILDFELVKTYIMILIT